MSFAYVYSSEIESGVLHSHSGFSISGNEGVLAAISTANTMPSRAIVPPNVSAKSGVLINF